MRFHDIKPQHRIWTQAVCDGIATVPSHGRGLHQRLRAVDRGDVLACTFAHALACLAMRAVKPHGVHILHRFAGHAADQLRIIAHIAAQRRQDGLDSKLKRLAITGEAICEESRQLYYEGDRFTARVLMFTIDALVMGQASRLRQAARGMVVAQCVQFGIDNHQSRLMVCAVFRTAIDHSRDAVREASS